ncbi:probable disease resistance protein At1g61300 isoform X1 [Punica granatum]|nr:probable disease resistance protein At1g61300 isoform X1 [Punica granatum]OWM66093.1 hypothetical protein CDL15_Pgr015520 [Punica granatum]
MDWASLILDIMIRSWDCTAKCRSYVQDLEENLENLGSTMDELTCKLEDRRREVEQAEQQGLKRTSEVDRWLEKVEVIKKEVPRILERGEQEKQKKCFGGLCTKNCRSCYKLGKVVVKKQSVLRDLLVKSHFNQIAYRPVSARVEERPMDKVVGFESTFEEAWICVEDGSVRSIGMFGMGGVGKTTLLTKIHNELAHSSQDYDAVLWIVVSKQANAEKIQKDVWRKLGLPESELESSNKEDRAPKIFSVLKRMKFILFLDDIWERIDLVSIGIPSTSHQNRFKIIFTTRSEEVCGFMQADRSIKVQCLPTDKALELFQEKVSKETWDAHPDIPELAEKLAGECKCLPLALITVGRAMASKKNPHEWKHAVEVLRHHPATFSGMKNDVFVPLEFSYESLPDETLKRCFLYCTMFPEDYGIRKDDLILLWIAEGFLDEYDHDIHKARDYGESIIGSLTRACLLESIVVVEPFGLVTNVKMHEVVRDMALWIDSEHGVKKNKVVVNENFHAIESDGRSERWKDVETVSLWRDYRSMEWFPTSLSCSNLRTLILRGTQMQILPNGFFSSMPSLRILDLSYNKLLAELPEDIGQLSNLRYLNLGGTPIVKLPIQLKNLKKLRVLLIGVDCECVPKEVISNLHSLRVFRWMHNSGVLTQEQQLSVIDELELKKEVSEVSLSFRFAESVRRLLRSSKLQTRLRSLIVVECLDMTSVTISSLKAKRMEHLSDLYICYCNELEEIKVIDMDEEEGRPDDQHIPHEYYYSKLRNESCFRSLCSVTIAFCNRLKDVTSIVCYAPNLMHLYIHECPSMQELIVNDTEEDKDHNSRQTFLRLATLYLINLDKLESIGRRKLPFPSLKMVSIYECPSLKKLPFDQESVGNSLKEIQGKKEWWDGLQWDDPATKNVFSLKFVEIE